MRAWLKQKWENLKDKIRARRRSIRNTALQAFYPVVTLGAAAGLLMWGGIPGWIAVTLLFVLFTHEMGHYFAAKMTGADPWMPFFVPAYPFVFGATYIANRSSASQRWIAIAGPTAGLTACALVALVGVATGHSEVVLIAGIAAIGQALSITIGRDGSKYRTAVANERLMANGKQVGRVLTVR